MSMYGIHQSILSMMRRIIFSDRAGELVGSTKRKYGTNRRAGMAMRLLGLAVGVAQSVQQFMARTRVSE